MKVDKNGKGSAHVQVLHRLCDVELVHGGDNDGRGGEEEQQEEEDTVDDEAAQPPGDPADGQMLPAGKKGHTECGVRPTLSNG